jgi:hypothetical protein
MNDDRKWNAIRHKIEESSCVALYLKETKRSSFDISNLKNFGPRRFSHFTFSPSDGASGGLLIVWNGNLCSGTVIDTHRFAFTVKLRSLQSSQEWLLTNIYGPCAPGPKAKFTNWFYNYDSSNYDLWKLVGDFNLMLSPDNRNRLGGNVQDMLLFNDIIHHLDLVVVPPKDRFFTWSNMQDNCLLEKLDWVFTNSDWTLAFPNMMAHTLTDAVLDHLPYVMQMLSAIPRTNTFRFENHWISHPGFMPIVEQIWNQSNNRGSIALIISGELKALRSGLKAWSRELSILNRLINNTSFVLALLDGLEEQRPLSVIERNFRKHLKVHLINLLEAKKVYWKQRSTIRWVRFGDETHKAIPSHSHTEIQEELLGM